MAKPDKSGKPAAPKSSSTAVANPAATPPAPVVAAPMPAGIKVTRNIALPVLNLKPNETRYLAFASKMRVSDYVDPNPKKDAAGKVIEKKAATIAEVGDVTTGEAFLLLVPAVVEANIKRSYPDDSYVGCAFSLTKLPKRPGKSYFDFQILQIEVDAAAMQAAAAAAPESPAATE